MEEIYEVLGLDEGAPTAKIVSTIEALQDKIGDKDAIITGLQNQIENYEEQIKSISSGVAEARVKDLIQKVQNETGYHVGKDQMERLQKKAAQHLYASEDEQESIWEDMKALTIAYGAKLDLDDRINSLRGDRNSESDEDPRHAKAKALVESGDAESWSQAFDMIQEEEINQKEED